jgi:hypothetical protein
MKDGEFKILRSYKVGFIKQTCRGACNVTSPHLHQSMKHLELESQNAIFVLVPASETESVWTVMNRLRAQVAAHATISGFRRIIFTCSYTGPPNTGAPSRSLLLRLYLLSPSFSLNLQDNTFYALKKSLAGVRGLKRVLD